MDSSAIQLIQDTAVKAAGANILKDNDGTLAAIVLHQDEKIESLERIQLNRYRFRGRLATHSLADFISYVKERTKEAGVDADRVPAFINEKDRAATVFFNLGNVAHPGHGDDTATLSLQPTAGFCAVSQASRTSYTQAGLIEFIEDWHAQLSARSEGDQSISLVAALTAIRKVTIKSQSTSENTVSAASASRSLMEETEARGAGGLPHTLTFRCAPYLGFTERDFVLRLSVLTGGTEPVIKLRAVNAEAQAEDIVQEFKSLLFDALKDVATITVGTFTP